MVEPRMAGSTWTKMMDTAEMVVDTVGLTPVPLLKEPIVKTTPRLLTVLQLLVIMMQVVLNR